MFISSFGRRDQKATTQPTYHLFWDSVVPCLSCFRQAYRQRRAVGLFFFLTIFRVDVSAAPPLGTSRCYFCPGDGLERGRGPRGVLESVLKSD